MPDRIHESLFERGHEDAIRDPVGGIGGRFAIRNHLKLLHDRAGIEEEFADLLEEEDGAIGGFRHRGASASNMVITTASRFLPDRIASTQDTSEFPKSERVAHDPGKPLTSPDEQWRV